MKEHIPFIGIYRAFSEDQKKDVQSAIAELVAQKRTVTVARVMEVLDAQKAREEAIEAHAVNLRIIIYAQETARTMLSNKTYWDMVKADRKRNKEIERELARMTQQRVMALVERVTA